MPRRLRRSAARRTRARRRIRALVMANFPAGMMNTFLGLFRRMSIAPVALKAMLTPTNAAWDSEKLHEELAGEHRAMTSGEGKRHQG